MWKSTHKHSKYHNVPVVINGRWFASRKEGRRYQELKLAEKSKAIKNLELQSHFVLQNSFERKGKKYRPIVYVGDFQYEQDGKIIVEDVKGFTKDKVWLLKSKMFNYQYPDIELRVV